MIIPLDDKKISKNKTYVILHQDDIVGICYVKDIVGEFVDCDTIFCSNNEITLSFNDRFHNFSLKEIKKEEIKEIEIFLDKKIKIFKNNIKKFCENYE